MGALDRFKSRKDLLPPEPFVPAKPISRMELKREIAGDQGVGYVEYVEIQRITNLPIIYPMTEEEVSSWTREHILASAWNSNFRLFREQAEAGLAYEMYSGAFCTIGVGFGKTLASLMIAGLAYAKGLRRIVYMLPPNVLAQLEATDIAWARTKIPMGYSIHILGGLTKDRRQLIAKSGRSGLYVMPYSLLSTTDGESLLQDIAPELIIADEAHNLAKARAARSKRVWKYVNSRKPEMVALSGTMSQKSLKDFWHLANASLKDNSPLPISSTLASEWGVLIDATAEWDGGSTATGPLLPLVSWARKNFPKEAPRMLETIAGFRHAFQLRLNSAPGVVDSGDSSIGTSLVLCNSPVPDYEKSEGWERLDALGKQVNEAWLTPNGDEIDHAIHTFKWAYELYGGGFYNELTWPTTETLASRKNIPLKAASELIDRSKEYHLFGQEYAKTLRRWLADNHIQGLDTPFLVGNDMRLNGPENVGAELFDTWSVWKTSDFEGRIDRDSRAVRVCAFKIRHCLRWVSELPKGEGAIIWVFHKEVGQWMYETLTGAGVDVLHCPAGPLHDRAILDPKNSGKIIVASLTAHGTGKNLQHFQNQFYLQWPRPAKDAEQSLGRTHRSGQKADELLVYTCHTALFDHLNFAACLNDALYTHQTMRSRQKLIYATYYPLPMIFPQAVLIERGFETKILPPEAIKILEERFKESKT